MKQRLEWTDLSGRSFAQLKKDRFLTIFYRNDGRKTKEWCVDITSTFDNDIALVVEENYLGDVIALNTDEAKEKAEHLYLEYRLKCKDNNVKR